MPIDPQTLGQILLAVITGMFTVTGGIIALLTWRSKAYWKREFEREKKARELSDANAAQIRADADHRTAEADRIKAEAATQILHAQREKQQAEQNSAMQYNWQTMLERAFNRMADNEERNHEVQAKVSNAIGAHTDAANRIVSWVQELSADVKAGNQSLKTDIGEVHTALRAVNDKVSPLAGVLTDITNITKEMLELLQRARFLSLTELAPESIPLKEG